VFLWKRKTQQLINWRHRRRQRKVRKRGLWALAKCCAARYDSLVSPVTSAFRTATADVQERHQQPKLARRRCDKHQAPGTVPFGSPDVNRSAGPFVVVCVRYQRRVVSESWTKVIWEQGVRRLISGDTIDPPVLLACSGSSS